jgi:hypothetical protein
MRRTQQEKAIGSLRDQRTGIKDHLSFLRSLKRELKWKPHNLIGEKRLESMKNGQIKKCIKNNKKT